jgi:hypothetical protein
MGQVRRAIHRLACGECLAPAYDPCVAKRGGRPMKGYHCSRRLEGKYAHLNQFVRKLEGDDDDEGLWRFVWEAIGLPANKYPGSKPYWHFMPELDPANGYHGDF